jgi:hypothetical protein
LQAGGRRFDPGWLHALNRLYPCRYHKPSNPPWVSAPKTSNWALAHLLAHHRTRMAIGGLAAGSVVHRSRGLAREGADFRLIGEAHELPHGLAFYLGQPTMAGLLVDL